MKRHSILSRDEGITGDRVTILYNPDNPEDVIAKGKPESIEYIFTAITFLVIGVGLIAMFFVLPDI